MSLQYTATSLRVDFYHIQSFTGLFDPRMIRSTVDLQHTYAVEYEYMACLQASRRGELKVRDLLFGINSSPRV